MADRTSGATRVVLVDDDPREGDLPQFGVNSTVAALQKVGFASPVR